MIVVCCMIVVKPDTISNRVIMTWDYVKHIILSELHTIFNPNFSISMKNFLFTNENHQGYTKDFKTLSQISGKILSNYVLDWSWKYKDTRKFIHVLDVTIRVLNYCSIKHKKFNHKFVLFSICVRFLKLYWIFVLIIQWFCLDIAIFTKRVEITIILTRIYRI